MKNGYYNTQHITIKGLLKLFCVDKYLFFVYLHIIIDS